MDISANKSDVSIFLYQVLHFWHTHSSLRNYSPLLKILKAFKKYEKQSGRVWIMSQVGNGWGSMGKMRVSSGAQDLDCELVGLT